jgi:hypothetical protein
MGEALLGFLGVILGAAIAGGISLWQVQFVTVREREAQRMRREQERTDRRDAFQRETLLALQDATSRMRHATFQEHTRRSTLNEESWAERGEPPFTDEWIEAAERILWLQARLLDEELRQLVERLRHESANVMTAEVKDVAFKCLQRAATLNVEASVRISTLLRDLF